MLVPDTISFTTTETVSGRFIDLSDPRPSDLNINDIAWALSRISRFGGHSLSKIPYTVAQHTVVVSRYVEEALTPGTHLNEVFLEYVRSNMEVPNIEEEELQRWLDFEERASTCPEDLRRMYAFHGLMHDFAEAYLMDLPTPVKRLPGVYEAYKAHELKMDAMIYDTFGLGYSATQYETNWKFGLCVVGWADMYALLIEAYHFMPSRGMNWAIPLPRPSLFMLNSFKWPLPNMEAYEEVVKRFEELKPNQVWD